MSSSFQVLSCSCIVSLLLNNANRNCNTSRRTASTCCTEALSGRKNQSGCVVLVSFQVLLLEQTASRAADVSSSVSFSFRSVCCSEVQQAAEKSCSRRQTVGSSLQDSFWRRICPCR